VSDELPNLSLAITTVEDTNYGDHGDRIRKAHAYIPGETVEDLAKRVFSDLPPRAYRQHNYGDVIEVLVVVGTAEPKPTEPNTWDASEETF
jgi:hypothetical protein